MFALLPPHTSCVSCAGQPGGAGEPLRRGHAGPAEGPGGAGRQAGRAGCGAGRVRTGHDGKAGDCTLAWEGLSHFMAVAIPHSFLAFSLQRFGLDQGFIEFIQMQTQHIIPH